MILDRICVYCKEELKGRSDKKFCDAQCKSAYQYQQTKQQPQRFFNKVDNQLRCNRKILKDYNKGGKVTVREAMLLSEGFDPNFFTHFWKNQKGEIYLFVYEYGFRKIKENRNNKYVLVLWQEYMSKR